MTVKEQLISSAMKAMQSDSARKLMGSERFQQVMAVAFRTTFRVRNSVDATRKRIARTLNVPTNDEVRELRRSLERLERRLRRSEKARAAEKE